MLATTPPPPYYAVIFTSVRTGADEPGYAQAAEEMLALAARQPGFLGVETAHEPGGIGITVSYWASEADIASWKRNADHAAAQKAGRERWYRAYQLRICRVERAYSYGV